MIQLSRLMKYLITCGILLQPVTIWSQTFNEVFPASNWRRSMAHNLDIDPLSDSLVIHAITINESKSLIRHKIAADGLTYSSRSKEFADTSLAPGMAESFRLEGSASMCAYGTGYEAIFEQLDSNFESVYRINRSHTDTSYCLYNCSMTCGDGNNIATRTCVLQYDSVIGDDAVILIMEKFDPLGNLLWSTQFIDDVYAFEVSSLAEMPNGDILVSGLDRDFWQTDHSILHFSSTGEFIDQAIFTPTPNNNLWDQGCQCTLFTDTTVVCAYTQALFHAFDDPFNSPEYTIRQLHLMEYNPNTNEILWDAAYDSHVSNMHYVQDIEKTSNGNLIVVGSLYHGPKSYPLCDSTFSFTFSYLAQFNPLGELMWSRNFTHGFNDYNYAFTEHILYDVEEMPDGGFAAAGDHYDYYFVPQYSPWVIRTDEWGCVEPGCQNIAVAEHEPDHFATVFPNPSTGALNIHSSHATHLQLYNSNGQLLHEQNLLHSGQHAIALTDPLPAGIYLVQLSSSRSTQTLKWVVVE